MIDFSVFVMNFEFEILKKRKKNHEIRNKKLNF